jgi:hypothetical protein
VSAGMGAQHGGAVDVEGLGVGAPRVVGGEAEGVEVLVGGDDRIEAIVGEVGRRGELGLEDLACDGDGVVRLEVYLAGCGGEDVLGYVVPLIGGVCLVVDGDCLWWLPYWFPGRGGGLWL